MADRQSTIEPRMASAREISPGARLEPTRLISSR